MKVKSAVPVAVPVQQHENKAKSFAMVAKLKKIL
jgi:hypothetical protein